MKVIGQTENEKKIVSKIGRVFFTMLFVRVIYTCDYIINLFFDWMMIFYGGKKVTVLGKKWRVIVERGICNRNMQALLQANDDSLEWLFGSIQLKFKCAEPIFVECDAFPHSIQPL